MSIFILIVWGLYLIWDVYQHKKNKKPIINYDDSMYGKTTTIWSYIMFFVALFFVIALKIRG